MPDATKAISLSSKPPEPGSHGYTEIRSIGRGSFGEATLVQDRDGHCFVMKTVDIGNLDIEAQKDAVNEVRVLSSLKHPYIVRYQESFINEGTLAIVMDYAEGGDLSKRISERRRCRESFDEPQILRWFTQACLGLKYLHKRNIIHRDIKPQNIFLTKNDDLRIGDFGISKKLGGKAQVVEQTIGTPYYLSPEICTERLYSFASDMWALGCVLFELTALHVPFEAQHIASLIKKITSGVLPVVPQAYSREVRQFVISLLCQDHKRRPMANDIVQGAVVQAEMRKMLGVLPNATPEPSPPGSALPSHRSQSPRTALDMGPASALQPQSQQPGSPRPFSAMPTRPTRAMRPSSAMPMRPPPQQPDSPRPAIAMRPTSAMPMRPGSAMPMRPIDMGPANTMRQQSQRAQSPRSMLRQSATNLIAKDPVQPMPNQRPKAQQEGSALFRAVSAGGNKARDLEDMSGRKPNFPRPPSPSPFKMTRNARPRSAAPYGNQRRSYGFAGG